MTCSAKDCKPARVYGQPLYVSAAASGLGQDLVLIATASNDVFALDVGNQGVTRRDQSKVQADLLGSTCRLLALLRHAAMSEFSLLSGVNRTSRLRPPTSEFDPKRTSRRYPAGRIKIQIQSWGP
jgi:hypothetical protein